MVWFTVLGALAVVTYYFLLNRRSKKMCPAKPINDSEDINSLSIEQARIMVDQLVINREKLFVDRGCASSVFHEQLGPITKEFFSKYRILHTQSGGFRLAADEIGPSEYMKGYLSVGHSEDWDVIQYPGDDTIFIVEGSEHSRDEIDVRFRSIYHLVLDEAQKA